MSVMVCSTGKVQAPKEGQAPAPPAGQPAQPAPKAGAGSACEGLGDPRAPRPRAYVMPGLPEPDQVSSVEMTYFWTDSAYRMSHDGQTVIVHTEDGIEVHRGGKKKKLVMDLTTHNPRTFMFHPDSRRVAFFAPEERQQGGKPRGKRVALMDVTNLAGSPPYTIIYDAGERAPFGIEWSPKGDALFVIEHLWSDGQGYSAIRRVDLESRKVTEIVRVLGEVDWFMPPVSRFENGSGPSNEPFRLVYGATDGLYVVDPQGRSPERVSDLPATGLSNIEWHPDPKVNEVLLYFRRRVTDASGRALQGVFQLRLGATPPELIPLHPQTDVHTLWYSPKGTYLSWASPSGVFYRPAKGEGETKTVPAPPDTNGQPLEVKGFCWSGDEEHLAFTAGTALLGHDLATGQTEVKGWFDGLFAAEPRFIGKERVILTLFEDIRLELWNRRNTPTFTMPLKGARPGQGQGAQPGPPPQGGGNAPPPGGGQRR